MYNVSTCTQNHAHACTCTCIYMYMYMYMCNISTCACNCADVHVHVHTCTPPPSSLPVRGPPIAEQLVRSGGHGCLFQGMKECMQYYYRIRFKWYMYIPLIPHVHAHVLHSTCTNSTHSQNDSQNEVAITLPYMYTLGSVSSLFSAFFDCGALCM